MHANYLLCLGSAVRTVKLQAQFRLHFYDLCGFLLKLKTEMILFSTYRCTSYFYLLINTFLMYFTCFGDFLIENVEGIKKKP